MGAMNLKRGWIALAALCMAAPSEAQHLWWDRPAQTAATALYGEVTVLATYPAVYYCGANWNPGKPAGGYCGIQDNQLNERRTIFSVWDTSATLHPKTIAADPLTIHGHFGGEGEGQHTHMLWPWKTGETFQFFVEKRPGPKDTTEASYYVFDRAKGRWLHSATISSPNGGAKSVSNLGVDALASFLEDFGVRDKDAPRLALYRLWLGDSIVAMHGLTVAAGDGIWGTLHDEYFLAKGDRAKLDEVFASMAEKYGKPAFGEQKIKMGAISDRTIPARVVDELRKATAR